MTEERCGRRRWTEGTGHAKDARAAHSPQHADAVPIALLCPPIVVALPCPVPFCLHFWFCSDVSPLLMSVRAMTLLLLPLSSGPVRHALLPSTLARRRSASCSARFSGSGSESQKLEPYGALLLDIGGTLLETSHPVPEVYARIGAKHGVRTTAAEIKKGFKKAFAEPWPERLRYEGDGRPFWRYAVATATGCSDETYFEELYQHFARGDAWKVASGAPEALARLRNAGVKLAVVSNFDSRLRPILRDLQVDTLFDALIISAEIGYEKPSREIFEAALNELGVDATVAVHVGDDPTNDKQGALAAGLESWLWKVDVKSFGELADRVLQPTTRTVR